MLSDSDDLVGTAGDGGGGEPRGAQSLFVAKFLFMIGTEEFITFDMDMNCSSIGSQDPQIKSVEDSVKFFIHGWSRRSRVEISRCRRLYEPMLVSKE